MGPVTSTSSQSSLKRKVFWKFTRLSSVVEKRSTTDQDIKIDLAQDSEGWGSFRDTDGAWRDHFFLGTILRLEELKINSATFCLFVKRNTRKGKWTMLVLWRRRACAFSRDRRQRCMFVADRCSGDKIINVPCWLFSEFWFRLADERLCNWCCEAEMRAPLFWAAIFVHSCAPIRFFPGCTYAGRLQRATGNTGVDVNMRSILVGPASDFQYFR